MYALKARDKLHKREKEQYEDRHSDHRGAAGPSRSREQRRRPSTTQREAKYIGTFSIEMQPSWKNDIGKAVKHHLSKLKTKDSTSCQLPVSVQINMEGVKVLSADGRDLIMAHALRRILYCTVDSKKHLFAMVSSNPDTGPEGIYSHVFATAKKDQANELNELVGKAFKASFTKKSLRRHKQKVKDTPWRVVTQEPPRPQSQPPAAARSSDQPLPSAPPLSIPPPSSPPAYNRDHLVQEAEQLQAEIAGLRARLAEIEAQMQAVSGVQDAVFQLTMQLSAVEDQISAKNRRLSVVRQELQAIEGPRSPPPPSYEGMYPRLETISLEDAEWFQEGLPREIAMEILLCQPVGGFLVRRSTSSPGCFALSMKAPNNHIVHYLIENANGFGFKLQGSHTVKATLVDLIQHLTTNQENLPCTLSQDTSNPAYLAGGGAATGDSDSDPDDVDFGRPTQYHLLS